MTQVTCKWLKSFRSKWRCWFGTSDQIAITLWHFPAAWTAAIACCRPAGILKKQMLQQRPAVRHWLLESMVDLPVGKRWRLSLCPLQAPGEEPSFTRAQCDNWEGVSWSWMLPARGQQLLFHLAFLCHPLGTPSMDWREPSELMNLCVAKRWLQEGQNSSACWEWKYFYALTTNRRKISWNMGYSSCSWAMEVFMQSVAEPSICWVPSLLPSRRTETRRDHYQVNVVLLRSCVGPSLTELW